MVYFLTQIFLVKLQYKVKEDWKNGSIPAKKTDRERGTLGGADLRYDQVNFLVFQLNPQVSMLGCNELH